MLICNSKHLEDVNKQVDEIKGTASATLTLAQQNEMNIQSMNTKIERLERTCTNLTAENRQSVVQMNFWSLVVTN